MSSFTSPLWVSPMSDGSRWRLARRFSYHVGSKRSKTYISVPKDFVTDFASVPKFLFFLPYWAKYNKSAVLHDYLYTSPVKMGKPITRKQADDIFLEAMLIDFRKHGFTGKVIAIMEYIAVRIAGWATWKGKEKHYARWQ